MTNRLKTNLSLNVIIQLREIFIQKKWEIEGESSFDRFCEMLSSLSPEQQECVLLLTKEFLRVEFNTYPFHIRKALSCIDSKSLTDVNKIYVMPLCVKSDYGKQKSSTFVAYGFHDLKSDNLFFDKEVNIISTPVGLPKNFNLSSGLLLLVDDFIGTGETAEGCLRYLVDEIGITLDKILILALVVQRSGYERLLSLGVNTVFSILRGKGISDGFVDPEKGIISQTMSSIEDMLEFENDIRFGYQGSEALVKMVRTPNNTFPVYWKTKKALKFTPPFPR